MRTRLLLLFAFAAATVLMNVASAGNIAHGVEVVVIDAGHGGKFPGAHYGGVYEKDLTLKVALKLGKLVEEGMPGVKVVYTRTADGRYIMFYHQHFSTTEISPRHICYDAMKFVETGDGSPDVIVVHGPTTAPQEPLL